MSKTLVKPGHLKDILKEWDENQNGGCEKEWSVRIQRIHVLIKFCTYFSQWTTKKCFFSTSLRKKCTHIYNQHCMIWDITIFESSFFFKRIFSETSSDWKSIIWPFLIVLGFCQRIKIVLETYGIYQNISWEKLKQIYLSFRIILICWSSLRIVE